VREPSWRTRRIEEARPAWLRKIAKLGGHDPHAKCETISMVAFEVLDASHPEENARRERERRISKAVAKLQGILARRDAAEREVAIAFLGDPAEFLAEKRFQSFLERYKDPLDSVDRFRRNLRGLNRAKKLKLSSEIIDRLAYRLLAASIAVRKMHAGKGYLEARRYIDAVPMIREMIYTVASEDTKLESDLRLYRRMREKSQSSRQA